MFLLRINIPKGQPLTAKNLFDSRRKMAEERGLADNLAKARAVRAQKKNNEKSALKNITSGNWKIRIND